MYVSWFSREQLTLFLVVLQFGSRQLGWQMIVVVILCFLYIFFFDIIIFSVFLFISAVFCNQFIFLNKLVVIYNRDLYINLYRFLRDYIYIFTPFFLFQYTCIQIVFFNVFGGIVVYMCKMWGMCVFFLFWVFSVSCFLGIYYGSNLNTIQRAKIFQGIFCMFFLGIYYGLKMNKKNSSKNAHIKGQGFFFLVRILGFKIFSKFNLQYVFIY
eukprot:TRINITY_DN3586_c0_g1_i20.p2 TRINITY_DN3586_c0_g1~~TRINITY_DN3586_c0_g1_i20.p2  ORF type:complete len:212 (-),score=-0.60 TRINITY_DN3586_c0_g1_i20:1045-1680(-)